nr:DEAD/DEAH box helicase [Beutenbergia cavernae]
MIPVLAKASREVEAAVKRGPATSSVRTKFHVVALLTREERARLAGQDGLSESRRAEEQKRLEGIATILATTAARDPALFDLLADETPLGESERELRRELLGSAGIDVPEEEPPADDVVDDAEPAGPAIPVSVLSRQRSNPFLAPDFDAVRVRPRTRRLDGWELLEPLLRSFELAEAGAVSCMDLPEVHESDLPRSPGRSLMRHQAQVVAAARDGHRTFLLADEPGLGKTAQALLAAEAADAYPLLAVVPNVVKTNWAREVGMWTPNRTASVIHGDGDDVDGFADIIVVNYEVLDRHVGWIATHGFRGMVVDEAHFIKNRSSRRSRNVLEISDRIRTRTLRPLLMALTGTPLINDIDDFLPIWQFLGWIDEKRPLGDLIASLEETGLTPTDRAFYPAARRAVVDMGIVRRRKADVAADIPARRVADLPVELDDAEGRSIRDAERDLARRMVERYDRVRATRDIASDAIDLGLVRQVATWEREGADAASGENVFSMMRRIGRAKATLAADYAAQLAHNVGKVVFFAKHIEVMDAAEELFARRGLRYASIRGEQTTAVRERNVTAFLEDPEVAVVVCSLTAAGVGINLQVASDLVLAELSWTDAEQTQAIDRVHRIGQSQPVTAWRIIAAQTIDARIAELIDAKAGLAARALDGAGEVEAASVDVQLEALATLLESALLERGDGTITTDV